MKLKILLLTLSIAFTNQLAFSQDNKIEEPFELADSSTETKIHIVKKGDTLTSISKLYSISKQTLIDANQLANENYIFIGQNLKLTKESSNKLNNVEHLKSVFHEVKEGESLTEISNIYKISIDDLIKINNLKDPNEIKIGSKLNLKSTMISPEEFKLIQENEQVVVANNSIIKTYGPLSIKSESLTTINRRQILNAKHKNGSEIILSLECTMKKIDVRRKGGKWQGWQPAQKDFEKELLADYCSENI